jgi:amidase
MTTGRVASVGTPIGVDQQVFRGSGRKEVGMSELWELDATAQAELIIAGKVSPGELVDAAIARAETVNPEINAIIHERYEAARAETRLTIEGVPFRGVPFAVKDLGCPTAGDPYHCGTRFLRDAGYVAPADSHLAAVFRAAGLVSLGKTNTPEIGASATTEPLAFGPTRNPWDPTRSSGGSSGGSCAAVAAGIIPIAHANDAGGSIRIPASACGVVGLKPSRGRVSSAPAADLLGFAVQLAVSRSVRDIATVLDRVAGPVAGDHAQAPPPLRPYRDELGAPTGRLRVGLMTQAPGHAFTVDLVCAEAAESAARLLEGVGHRVEVAHPAVLDEPTTAVRAYSAFYAARVDALARMAGTEPGPDGLEPGTLELIEHGRQMGAPDLVAAIEETQLRTRRLHQWWESGFDLLLTPTCGERPPLIGDLVGTADDPSRGLRRTVPFAAYTMPFNQSGQPAVSLPLHWIDDGLPIGVQLVAAWGREDILLRVSAQLEEAQPWAHRRPPLFD